MSDVIIWHNPRCSKSRETLALLQENGVTPQVRRYLDDPPTADEITAALTALQVNAAAMMRTKDARFSDLGLTPDMDNDKLIAAMAAHPALIERPIVFKGDKAAIGRPPAAVLDIL